MRHLALLLLFCCMTSCSMSWEGQGSGITSDQASRDIQDVAALANRYEANAYFTDLRRRQSGRANAFGRDLRSIGVFIDRHFFNYSTMDPYVNYESDTGYADHLLRFALTTVAR
jgi:hypothetical protein